MWFLVFRSENILKCSDSLRSVVSAAFICAYHSISMNISEHLSKDTSYSTQSHNTSRRDWITLCQQNPKFSEMKQHERHNKTIYTTKYCSITLFTISYQFPRNFNSNISNLSCYRCFYRHKMLSECFLLFIHANGKQTWFNRLPIRFKWQAIYDI